jgi:hypothetical protein
MPGGTVKTQNARALEVVKAIHAAAEAARLNKDVRGNTMAIEWDLLNSIISLSKALADSMEV